MAGVKTPSGLVGYTIPEGMMGSALEREIAEMAYAQAEADFVERRTKPSYADQTKLTATVFGTQLPAGLFVAGTIAPLMTLINRTVTINYYLVGIMLFCIPVAYGLHMYGRYFLERLDP